MKAAGSGTETDLQKTGAASRALDPMPPAGLSAGQFIVDGT
jgi:hypothetical protein